MAETVTPADEDEQRDCIHRAVQLVAAGSCVGLPTEAGYVAATLAVNDAAVQRLAALPGASLAILARSVDEAYDLVPELPRNGAKIATRCWPGPVFIRTSARSGDGGTLEALGAEARRHLVANQITCSTSAEPLIGELGRLIAAPLVISLPDRPFITVSEFSNPAGGAAACELTIDLGEARFKDGPTIVNFAGDSWSVEREGVVSTDAVRRILAEVIVFVCTGNTCRSPMAEAMFRTMLAKRAGCTADELAEHGYIVSSAGLAAGYGSAASPEGISLLTKRGIDLTAHESQPLTGRLLDHADFVYTMTRNHRNAILGSRPELEEIVQVLARDGSDVPDPIGGGMDEYQRCLNSIETHLKDILSEIPFPASP